MKRKCLRCNQYRDYSSSVYLLHGTVLPSCLIHKQNQLQPEFAVEIDDSKFVKRKYSSSRLVDGNMTSDMNRFLPDTQTCHERQSLCKGEHQWRKNGKDRDDMYSVTF
ncbi:hypothetical protein RF11_05579 [Thelohanellus kitauei]|uniref:Uncharacterized protein n=1 Tax=Thelohanellus kitauei TaxID=669202 RepID=A0A0C2M0G0_THEKT|nr:hypothetical protein RF11_05579 [Thelohanellus kitauei]